MNHPSDYMNNFEDSLSSDSSNPTIKILPKQRAAHSLHHPSPPLHKKNTKPNQPKKHKQPPAPSLPHKRKAVSHYLILGDSYLSHNHAKELTRRLLEQQRAETTRVMRLQRLKRKEQKTIKKISAYIQTFVQTIRIARALRALTLPQKTALYRMLKAEQQEQQRQSENIEYYFQQAVEQLERTTQQYELQHPHRHRLIARWKNHKLHQLSSAKTFLDPQQLPCDLNTELAILEQQKFFPELKQQAQELSSNIATHLSEQQHRNSTVEEDSGVRWVLNRLLAFILQKEEIVNSILTRLQQGQFPLLEDGLFIIFEREVIGSSQDAAEAEEQRYIHMFNKAIFDLINDAAPALLPQCPYSSIDEVLAWIFELAPRFQRQDAEGECLLKVDEGVFDALLEQVLWDFLEYL